MERRRSQLDEPSRNGIRIGPDERHASSAELYEGIVENDEETVNRFINRRDLKKNPRLHKKKAPTFASSSAYNKSSTYPSDEPLRHSASASTSQYGNRAVGKFSRDRNSGSEEEGYQERSENDSDSDGNDGPVNDNMTLNGDASALDSAPPCPICLQPFEDRSVLPSCFHEFCHFCIRKWAEVSRSCPLCKQHFQECLHDFRTDRDYIRYTFPVVPVGKGSDKLVIQPQRSRPELSTMPSSHNAAPLTPEQILNEAKNRIRAESEEERRKRIWVDGKHTMKDFKAMSSLDKRRLVYQYRLEPVNPPQGTRKPTPELFRKDKGLQERIRPWITRDLQILLKDSDVSIIQELVVSVIERFELTSTKAADELRPYIVKSPARFLRELYHFSQSTLSMKQWDKIVKYHDPKQATVEATSSSGAVAEASTSTTIESKISSNGGGVENGGMVSGDTFSLKHHVLDKVHEIGDDQEKGDKAQIRDVIRQTDYKLRQSSKGRDEDNRGGAHNSQKYQERKHRRSTKNDSEVEEEDRGRRHERKRKRKSHKRRPRSSSSSAVYVDSMSESSGSRSRSPSSSESSSDDSEREIRRKRKERRERKGRTTKKKKGSSSRRKKPHNKKRRRKDVSESEDSDSYSSSSASLRRKKSQHKRRRRKDDSDSEDLDSATSSSSSLEKRKRKRKELRSKGHRDGKSKRRREETRRPEDFEERGHGTKEGKMTESINYKNYSHSPAVSVKSTTPTASPSRRMDEGSTLAFHAVPQSQGIRILGRARTDFHENVQNLLVDPHALGLEFRSALFGDSTGPPLLPPSRKMTIADSAVSVIAAVEDASLEDREGSAETPAEEARRLRCLLLSRKAALASVNLADSTKDVNQSGKGPETVVKSSLDIKAVLKAKLQAQKVLATDSGTDLNLQSQMLQTSSSKVALLKSKLQELKMDSSRGKASVAPSITRVELLERKPSLSTRSDRPSAFVTAVHAAAVSVGSRAKKTSDGETKVKGAFTVKDSEERLGDKKHKVESEIARMDNAHGTSLASTREGIILCETAAMTASNENPSPPLTIRDKSVVCSGLSHKNYMPSVLPSMISESSVDNNESEGDGKDSLTAVNKQKNLCVSPISDHGREASSTGLTSSEAKSPSNFGSRVVVDEEFAVDFELSSDDDVGVGRKDKRVDAAKTLSPVSFGREEVSLVSKNRREGRDTEVRVERMGEIGSDGRVRLERVSRHGGDMAKRMLGSLGMLRKPAG